MSVQCCFVYKEVLMCLLFPDLHKMVDLFNLLYSGVAGFLLAARRHDLHLIIPKEVTYSKRASRLRFQEKKDFFSLSLLS